MTAVKFDTILDFSLGNIICLLFVIADIALKKKQVL